MCVCVCPIGGVSLLWRVMKTRSVLMEGFVLEVTLEATAPASRDTQVPGETSTLNIPHHTPAAQGKVCLDHIQV